MSGQRLLIVDGYNVIRNTPGLAAAERGSLAAGRDALVSRLLQKYRHTPTRVIVVFDGNSDTRHILPLRGIHRGQVIYSRDGETADMVIAEIARQESTLGTEVVVVTDDLEVRLSVSQDGGRPASVSHLAEHVGQPDRFRLRRYRHQQYLRGEWERDDASTDRSGNPHRSPRRRRKPDRPLL